MTELEIERQKVKLLHNATIVLRNALTGSMTTAQEIALRQASSLLDQCAALVAEDIGSTYERLVAFAKSDCGERRWMQAVCLICDYERGERSAEWHDRAEQVME